MISVAVAWLKESVMNTPLERYNHTAMALHWLVALLIFAAFPLGVYMHDLPLSPAKLQYYSYHKWMGITILLLVIVRVVWRFTHTPPSLPASTPRWEVVVMGAYEAGVERNSIEPPFSVPDLSGNLYPNLEINPCTVAHHQAGPRVRPSEGF